MAAHPAIKRTKLRGKLAQSLIPGV